MSEKTTIERIEELEERIKALEEKESAAAAAAKRWTTKEMEDLSDIAKKRKIYDNHKYDFPVPTCQVCGLKFEGAMGYVCMQPLCPSKFSCFRS